MFELPLEMIATQGIFAILFVWLLVSTKKESKEREDRLMAHVEKTTETLDVLSNRMERVSTKVDHIDIRLSAFESKDK